MRGACVVGLGLIGGSVLRAASAAGQEAWGVTVSQRDADAASAEGFAASTDVDAALRRAAERDALVVLAVPMPQVSTVLRSVARIAPNCLVTDVVSVKGPVFDAVQQFAPGLRYVGGHPMAGASASGWPASTAELFRGAAWVVATEDDPDVELWLEVAGLALRCGAHVVPAGIADHDDAVARISHLPHLLAATLASVGADGGPLAMALAAGSFADGTRVAGSRPDLVTAMCEANASALLTALDDALGRLGAARGSLASTGSLAAAIEAGHRGRETWASHRAAGTAKRTFDITDPASPALLRDFGRAGGRIDILDGHLASGSERA